MGLIEPKPYKKRPVTIEAIQFTDRDSAEAIVNWVRSYGEEAVYYPLANPPFDGAYPALSDQISIATLEGRVYAELGSWVIKGVEDEFYPCRDDIFRKTYFVDEESEEAPLGTDPQGGQTPHRS